MTFSHILCYKTTRKGHVDSPFSLSASGFYLSLALLKIVGVVKRVVDLGARVVREVLRMIRDVHLERVNKRRYACSRHRNLQPRRQQEKETRCKQYLKPKATQLQEASPVFFSELEPFPLDLPQSFLNMILVVNLSCKSFVFPEQHACRLMAPDTKTAITRPNIEDPEIVMAHEVVRGNDKTHINKNLWGY